MIRKMFSPKMELSLATLVGTRHHPFLRVLSLKLSKSLKHDLSIINVQKNTNFNRTGITRNSNDTQNHLQSHPDVHLCSPFCGENQVVNWDCVACLHGLVMQWGIWEVISQSQTFSTHSNHKQECTQSHFYFSLASLFIISEHLIFVTNPKNIF